MSAALRLRWLLTLLVGLSLPAAAAHALDEPPEALAPATTTGAPDQAQPVTPASRDAPPAPAPHPPLSWFHRHRHGQAWVAAANPMAVDAGLAILARGGSAIDAAVAVQAMLGLVEPQSSGVGGGAFLMYYDASTGSVAALDGREKAPLGATPDMFLDEHGKPMGYLQAVRTGRSTGVPGALALLSTAHARFGKLPWRELFTPAIRAATDGFQVSHRLAGFLAPDFVLPATPQVRSLFSRPDGQPLQAGDLFQNPKYAHTLSRIADEGPSALYKGSIAAEIVARTHEEPSPG